MARRVHFSTPELSRRNRIVLNVSGHRFMTDKNSLIRHPHTLLGSHMLARYFDEVKQEYFFDRDPHLFRYILNYYQSGKLHSSPDDCPVAFKDELDYFGIPLCELEDCCSTNVDDKEKHPCHYAVRKASVKAVHSVPANYLAWKRFDNDRRTETRKLLRNEDGVRRLTYPVINLNHLPFSRTGKRQESSSRKQRQFNEIARATHSRQSVNSADDYENSHKCQINWKCTPPKTNTGKFVHKAFNFLYGLFIISSVVSTTVETIDCENGMKCLELHPDLFFALDTMFVAVFTLEFLIRFALSKNRCTFMKQIFNIIDLLAILPYYISLIASLLVDAESVTLLITLRVLRVSRIMKLTRGSTRLQSLIYTLKNCSTDLLFLYFTFTLGILLFGSVLYFVERTDNPESFKSIPHSLWYTCVTMMTTG